MRTLALILVTASLVSAQYPIGSNALRWTGTSQAGPLCWGFSCTPQVATLVRGETGTLFVRAEYQQPYLLGFSLTATRCLGLPGLYNQLVLDDPITVFAEGTCRTGSPVLSCPGGTDTIPVTIPVNWPVGLTFTVQGLTGVPSYPGSGQASFTQAITFTVI